MEVARVLIEAPANVDSALTDEETPLIVAAQHGHPEFVQMLLPLTSALNARVIDPSPLDDDCSGQTAIGIAIKNDHSDVVALLRAAGALE